MTALFEFYFRHNIIVTIPIILTCVLLADVVSHYCIIADKSPFVKQLFVQFEKITGQNVSSVFGLHWVLLETMWKFVEKRLHILFALMDMRIVKGVIFGMFYLPWILLVLWIFITFAHFCFQQFPKYMKLFKVKHVFLFSIHTALFLCLCIVCFYAFLFVLYGVYILIIMTFRACKEIITGVQSVSDYRPFASFLTNCIGFMKAPVTTLLSPTFLLDIGIGIIMICVIVTMHILYQDKNDMDRVDGAIQKSTFTFVEVLSIFVLVFSVIAYCFISLGCI